jgi:hypothetical protein
MIFTAWAFIALTKKVDLAYILAGGAALSILISGTLAQPPLQFSMTCEAPARAAGPQHPWHFFFK